MRRASVVIVDALVLFINKVSCADPDVSGQVRVWLQEQVRRADPQELIMFNAALSYIEAVEAEEE